MAGFYLLDFFRFDHRACTALRADSLLSSAVSLSARILPPKRPPLRPIFTKYSRMSSGIRVMSLIVRNPVTKRNTIYVDLRKGVT